MSLIVRLIAGNPYRKTRLHSQRGDVIPLDRLVRNGPKTLVAGLARLVFGIRQRRPWISYDAQAVIALHLGPESQVLEFGSGMSTEWYARRSGSVFSIEDDPGWFASVGKVVPPNVTYKLAESREEYLTFPDRLYDLIMVDGVHRAACVEAALRFLAPGGICYLDNSDRDGDDAEARRLMLEFAGRNGCEVRRFTDFVTGQLFVEEGLMLRRQD